jgi:hypothetical protein
VASSDRLPTDTRTLTPGPRGVKQQDVPRRAARTYKREGWSRRLRVAPLKLPHREAPDVKVKDVENRNVIARELKLHLALVRSHRQLADTTLHSEPRPAPYASGLYVGELACTEMPSREVTKRGLVHDLPPFWITNDQTA